MPRLHPPVNTCPIHQEGVAQPLETAAINQAMDGTSRNPMSCNPTRASFQYLPDPLGIRSPITGPSLLSSTFCLRSLLSADYGSKGLGVPLTFLLVVSQLCARAFNPRCALCKEIIPHGAMPLTEKRRAYRFEPAKDVRSIYIPNQSGTQITRCVNALMQGWGVYYILLVASRMQSCTMGLGAFSSCRLHTSIN